MPKIQILALALLCAASGPISPSAMACDEIADTAGVAMAGTATAWPDPLYIEMLVEAMEQPVALSDEQALEQLVNAVAHRDAQGRPLRYTQRQYEDDLGKLFREQGAIRLSRL